MSRLLTRAERAARKAILDDLTEELRIVRQKRLDAIGPAGRDAWGMIAGVLHDRIRAMEPEGSEP